MATQIYQSIHTAQEIDYGIVLQKVIESTNTGIRLLSENPVNHGDIGDGAIDLSYSTTPSSVFGATGRYSFAIGAGTTASGEGSTATGWNSTASGENSFTAGFDTLASENSSIALGNSTIASGESSFASGEGTIAGNYGSTALGLYNIGSSVDTILEVGIGTNTTGANALEIYTNGRIHAPSLTTGLIIDAKSLTTKEYVDNHGTGLKRYTDDDTNYGWGFQCRIALPENYGSIGHGAVCFTSSLSASSTIGATGRHALAGGRETTASGTSATALGQVTVASGSESLATGLNTIASGGGTFTTGNYTIADNNYQTCIGQFNTAEELTTIFEVGIGTSDVARANAFEIYTNGRIHAPEQTIALHDNARSLVTKEYVDTNINSAVITPTVVEETALLSYTPNFDNNYFEYILTQASTINAPINVLKGKVGTIVLKQDVTGGWGATFNAAFIFPAGAPAINTTANAYNVFKYTAITAGTILMEFVTDFI